jgi:K+-transporting ATPase ATPase A chain
MVLDLAQIAIVLGLTLLLVRPVGAYMEAVFTHRRTWIDRVMDPVDNALYRLSGVDPKVQQRWPAYVAAMLLTNAVMFVVLFVILETQQFLPLNPDGQGPVNPFLAFNTAASFITNTKCRAVPGSISCTTRRPSVSRCGSSSGPIRS